MAALRRITVVTAAVSWIAAAALACSGPVETGPDAGTDAGEQTNLDAGTDTELGDQDETGDGQAD